MPVLTIDLQSVPAEHITNLKQFFAEQEKRGIRLWSDDKIYQFADGISFTFTHEFVLARESKKSDRNNKLRYHPFSKKNYIGGGNFGRVYDVEGTVIVHKDSIKFKTEGRDKIGRVVKRQKRNNEKKVIDHFESVQNEYIFSREIEYLAIKKPTITKNGDVIYTVMNKLPGKELKEIIFGKTNLSIEQRLELTKALLQALQDISNKGIIHCDIKPENIMVTLEPKISVKIFDFGLSAFTHNINGERKGSPFYMAPEVFSSPHCINPKVDVFSMARVIALLWGERKSIQELSAAKDKYGFLKSSVKTPPENRLTDIFTGIDGLDEKKKSDLYFLLKNMFNNNPRERYSIGESMDEFDKIIKSKNFVLSPSNANKVRNTNNANTTQQFFQPAPSQLCVSQPATNQLCVSKEQIQKIEAVIQQLEKECTSWWPYLNITKKRKKMTGLMGLLADLRSGETISAAISRAVSDYPELCDGKISTRTADLLKELSKADDKETKKELESDSSDNFFSCF